jgi:hypothetical protein
MTQLMVGLSDKDSMSVQAASNQPVSLLESTYQRQDMNQQIQMSIVKQVQDSQKSQAQALVQMIQQSTPQGTGQRVNILA